MGSPVFRHRSRPFLGGLVADFWISCFANRFCTPFFVRPLTFPLDPVLVAAPAIHFLWELWLPSWISCFLHRYRTLFSWERMASPLHLPCWSPLPHPVLLGNYGIPCFWLALPHLLSWGPLDRKLGTPNKQGKLYKVGKTTESEENHRKEGKL